MALRPERFRQCTGSLLRQLNLLICGADLDELKDLVAALVSTQTYATARMIEEQNRFRQANGGANGAHGPANGANGASNGANGAAHGNGGSNGVAKAVPAGNGTVRTN